MQGMFSYTKAAGERAMKVQEVILRAMAKKRWRGSWGARRNADSSFISDYLSTYRDVRDFVTASPEMGHIPMLPLSRTRQLRVRMLRLHRKLNRAENTRAVLPSEQRGIIVAS